MVTSMKVAASILLFIIVAGVVVWLVVDPQVITNSGPDRFKELETAGLGRRHGLALV